MERGPKCGFNFGMGGPWRSEECHCGHPHGFHHVRWEWGCHGEGHMVFRRRFISREERIAQLERYLEALRQEMKAVEEHLADLKAKAQEE